MRVSYLLGNTDALLGTLVHQAENLKKTSWIETAVELTEGQN